MKPIGYMCLVLLVSLPAWCQQPAGGPQSQSTEKHMEQLIAFRDLLDSPFVSGRMMAPKRIREARLEAIKTCAIDHTIVFPGDEAATALGTYLTAAIHGVTGWKAVPLGAHPDCTIDILPYGGEYADMGSISTDCSSLLGYMKCKSSDGSTLTANCDTSGCSSSSTGPSVSYRVAVTVPTGNGRRLMVGKSRKASALELMSDGGWLFELCSESKAGNKGECKQRVKQVAAAGQ